MGEKKWREREEKESNRNKSCATLSSGVTTSLTSPKCRSCWLFSAIITVPSLTPLLKLFSYLCERSLLFSPFSSSDTTHTQTHVTDVQQVKTDQRDNCHHSSHINAKWWVSLDLMLLVSCLVVWYYGSALSVRMRFKDFAFVRVMVG